MNYPEIKIVETGAAVRVQRLVRRYRAKTEVRRELGNECRQRGDMETALQMETKADAYESARIELERTMAGEWPPDPYEPWPAPPNAKLTDRPGSGRRA